jgi:uncharacterized membrane protein
MKINPYSQKTAYLMVMLGVLMVTSVLSCVIYVAFMVMVGFTPWSLLLFVGTAIINIFGYSLSYRLEKKRSEIPP